LFLSAPFPLDFWDHYFSATPLENVFVNDGHNGHEIVVIYHAEFVDKSLYEQSVIMGQEDDGTPFKAFWKPFSLFKKNCPPLYPTGLLELLKKN